jgi:NAD(P)-dependent dehydrogenase (short-subunit alcohol dehydrogenase family)
VPVNARKKEKSMNRKRILFVGAGNLCKQILQIMVPGNGFHFFVAGRSLEKTTRLCNLIELATLQLGTVASIKPVEMDVSDIARTSETLAQIKPDIVVNCASLQSWRVITELPKAFFDVLDQAQLGPWLPMHLVPAYHLMRAIKHSGIKTLTVNTAFPDAVNPVLDKAGLAPDVGIGNVANLIPATRMAIARFASCTPDQVQVKLIAQHYFSHCVPRNGLPREAQYNLSYRVNGADWTGQLKDADIFYLARTQFRRLGGVDGQFLTAASAVMVISNLFSLGEVEVHAPGPHGLPGGYPIRVGMGQILLSLPYGVLRADAIEINKRCQRQDGIELIKADATVKFELEQMSIMEAQLGFSMPEMKLQDVNDWAVELGCKYKAYAEKAWG